MFSSSAHFLPKGRGKPEIAETKTDKHKAQAIATILGSEFKSEEVTIFSAPPSSLKVGERTIEHK